MNRDELKIAQWSDVIRKAGESGMPVRRWLTQNNISKDAYYYWLRKIKRASKESGVKPFVELSVPEDKDPDTSYTADPVPVLQVLPVPEAGQEPSFLPVAGIRVRNMTIDIYPEASAGFLSELLEAACHVK